jgi:hypothetical protein
MFVYKPETTNGNSGTKLLQLEGDTLLSFGIGRNKNGNLIEKISIMELLKRLIRAAGAD